MLQAMSREKIVQEEEEIFNDTAFCCQEYGIFFYDIECWD